MSDISQVLLERWAEAAGNAGLPEQSDVLGLVFRHSPHLTESAIREAGLSAELAAGAALAEPEALFAAAAADLAAADDGDLVDTLSRWKRRLSLALAWHDLAGTATFEEVGRGQSRAAALSVETALNAAWNWARGRGIIARDGGERPRDLFILGLGKLGGEDLNYSSDIDLVAFFESEPFAVGPMQGKTEVAGKILKQVTKTLTRAGWRVDWRLRPAPSITPLAITTDAAFNYYFFHFDPWERLAFAKARPVAGDVVAARGFLSELGPYIWRRNLDYTALSEIRALKDTIHARHPGLATSRVREWRNRDDWGGFNVKLGAGGIREIEFTVQALQLLWGGRDETLRTRHTLTSLTRLTERGRLSTEECAALRDAYIYLRRLENRLQMVGDQQIHEVFGAADDQRALCALMGAPDIAAMNRDLARNTQAVFEIMNRHLEDVAEAPDALQGELHPIIAKWCQGLIPATRGQSGLRAAIALAPKIEAIARGTGNMDDALERFDRFLGELPASSGYLALLAEFPNVLSSLADGLISAPAMATLLEQSPHLIDRLVVGGEVSSVPGVLKAQAASAPHEEVWLERLRRVTNEELFAIYATVLRGKPVPEAESDLTFLARCVIVAARDAAADYLGQEGVDRDRIGVIGFGKLGMARMLPLSDLDLMFFIDEVADEADRKAASKLVSRTVAALSTRMREGVAYEIDMRLRPSGRSSPPLVTRAAFEKHHNEAARNWEHLALTAVRQVVGDHADFTAAIHSILTRPRDSDQLAGDAARMLLRLREHRIEDQSPDILAIKLRRGGLLELEFLISVLSLQWAADVPDLFETEHDARLIRLARAEKLEVDQARILTDALRFYRNGLFALRLLGVQGQEISALDPAILEKCLLISGCETAEDLVSGLSGTQQSVLEAVEAHIFEPAKTCDMENWDETTINWRNYSISRNH